MRILFISVIALVISACGSSNRTVDPAFFEGANTQAQELVVERYKIGVGDILAISVWDNPELTLNVPVRPDGYISMPLLGDISASGLDAEALAAKVTTLLEEQLRNPQVSIVVSQVNSSSYMSRIRVTGAVRNPISMPFSRGMSVLDAVLEAGGVSELASSNRAKLYRSTDDSLVEVEVRLGDILLRGRLETNYALQPGDVITVPERIF